MQPVLRLTVVFVCFLYAMLLVASLRWVIAPIYTYAGLRYEAISEPALFCWSWGLTMLGSLFLPVHATRPSHLFSWLLYILVVAPSLLIPPYASGLGYDYVFMQLCILAMFGAVCGVGSLPGVRLPSGRWGTKWIVMALGLYTLSVVAWLAVRVGIPTSIPAITNPYAQRAAFDAAVAGSGLLLYLMSWQVSVVNPALILIGLSKRKWTLFLLGVSLNGLIYMFAGHKSHLLSSGMVIGVYLLLYLPAYARGLLIGIGSIGVIVGTILFYTLTGDIFPASVFVRRLMMLPGLLTGQYFTYFTEHGFTYLFGPLSTIFNAPVPEMSTPRIIGTEYYGGPSTAANANLWADAYSAVGYIGMVIATSILVMVLWVMDALSLNRNVFIVIPLAAVSLFSLMNSALPVSLLTHGILVSIILMALLPETRVDSQDEQQMNTAECMHESPPITIPGGMS